MSRRTRDTTRTTQGTDPYQATTLQPSDDNAAFNPDRESFQIGNAAHGKTPTELNLQRETDPRRSMRVPPDANDDDNTTTTTAGTDALAGQSRITIPNANGNTLTAWGRKHPIPPYPDSSPGAIPLADLWGNFKGWSKPGYRNDGSCLMDFEPGPRTRMLGLWKKWDRTIHEELMNILPAGKWDYEPSSQAGKIWGERGQWGISLMSSADHWPSREKFEDAVMEFLERHERRRAGVETDEDVEIRRLLYETAKLVREETYMYVVHACNIGELRCRKSMRRGWQHIRRQQVDLAADERLMDDWQVVESSGEMKERRAKRRELETGGWRQKLLMATLT